MGKSDVKTVLKENVERVAKKRYGRVNVSKLAADTGIAIGGAQRVLSGEVSVGVELIQQIAAKCGLQPWQLLVPDMNPDAPPKIEVTPQSPRVAAIVRALNRLGEQRISAIEAVLVGMEAGPAVLHDDDASVRSSDRLSSPKIEKTMQKGRAQRRAKNEE